MAQVTSLDLVRREFRRDGPNQLCMTDITEHLRTDSIEQLCEEAPDSATMSAMVTAR